MSERKEKKKRIFSLVDMGVDWILENLECQSKEFELDPFGDSVV